MRQVLCTVGKLCRTFSQLHWSTFDAMPIEKRLVGRLNDLNIKTPTEIQQKVKIIVTCAGSSDSYIKTAKTVV